MAAEHSNVFQHMSYRLCLFMDCSSCNSDIILVFHSSTCWYEKRLGKRNQRLEKLHNQPEKKRGKEEGREAFAQHSTLLRSIFEMVEYEHEHFWGSERKGWEGWVWGMSTSLPSYRLPCCCRECPLCGLTGESQADVLVDVKLISRAGWKE